MGFNRAIGSRVAHTDLNIASGNLLILQNRLILLIHGALDQFSSASAANPRSTGVGQSNFVPFCDVENGFVFGTLNCFGTTGSK